MPGFGGGGFEKANNYLIELLERWSEGKNHAALTWDGTERLSSDGRCLAIWSTRNTSTEPQIHWQHGTARDEDLLLVLRRDGAQRTRPASSS